MEENRGIALRPLLSELAAELRATAPEAARALSIDLDLDTVYTTQDVAVAMAFLITEIVEFAMLNCPEEPIEVSMRRTSELTARLTISSPVLVPEEEDEGEKVQFERIVGGLAKQLRSTLDRKLGRYSVDLPAFPPVLRSLRVRRKNFSEAPELFASKARSAIWIVTFCPPALAIRLNGPGTANPPPPGGASGPTLVWASSSAAASEASAPDCRALRAACQWVRRMARIANSYRP